MMPLYLMNEFHHRACRGLGKRSVKNMVNPVSSSDPRQDAEPRLVQQKKQRDDARNVRNNRQPSPENAQRHTATEQNQAHTEAQNSQQAKGAALDVRA